MIRVRSADVPTVNTPTQVWTLRASKSRKNSVLTYQEYLGQASVFARVGSGPRREGLSEIGQSS
jgi:hypothetical protein